MAWNDKLVIEQVDWEGGEAEKEVPRDCGEDGRQVVWKKTRKIGKGRKGRWDLKGRCRGGMRVWTWRRRQGRKQYGDEAVGGDGAEYGCDTGVRRCASGRREMRRRMLAHGHLTAGRRIRNPWTAGHLPPRTTAPQVAEGCPLHSFSPLSLNATCAFLTGPTT